jgi:hypothetical protein
MAMCAPRGSALRATLDCRMTSLPIAGIALCDQ